MGGWGRRLTALGLLLSALGGGPLLGLAYIAPSAPPLLPVLLSLTVLPLGVACLAAGLIGLVLRR